EVVQPIVVGHRVPADERARLLRGDVAAHGVDYDRDLALVIQVTAARGAHHLPPVGVQRARGLLEVRGRGAERGAELGAAALVVEVHAEDLGGIGGREMHGLVERHPATVGCHELVALAGHRGGQPVQQDASRPHPHPFRSRSVPKRRIGRMSGPEGFMLPKSPGGRASIVPSPPWHYSGDVLTVEYRTDPANVAALLPEGVGLAEEDPGAVALIWADWQSCSDSGAELLDPVRSQYKECFVVVRCRHAGETYSRCVYIW